jgi:Hemerythrin HHE cation binding domain
MTESIWTAPSHRLDVPSARRSILVQHQRIRELLSRARDIAERALDQEPLPVDAVASAIGEIHATLDIHLRFEEKVLIDILMDDLPLGPLRAERLRDEHARQRATLTGIHEEAKAGPQVPMLAAKLAFLTTWLLEDMEEEERTMLAPDALRDDLVSIDQSDG